MDFRKVGRRSANQDEGLKGRILAYHEKVLAEWRIPTLFVSHDEGDVRRLAERIIAIEKGVTTCPPSPSP